jgi:hypothetical protein
MCHIPYLYEDVVSETVRGVTEDPKGKEFPASPFRV